MYILRINHSVGVEYIYDTPIDFETFTKYAIVKELNDFEENNIKNILNKQVGYTTVEFIKCISLEELLKNNLKGINTEQLAGLTILSNNLTNNKYSTWQPLNNNTLLSLNMNLLNKDIDKYKLQKFISTDMLTAKKKNTAN